jgi:hypothetical protein
MAIRKILRASGELSGLGISTAGVVLSALFAVCGITYQIYVMSYEIPAGYQKIDFTQLAADPRTGRIPEEIIALTPQFDEHGNIIRTGIPVFIEGYMYPTRQMTDIDSFMLVPFVEQGKFGATTRNPTEMIDVTLSGGNKVFYRTSLVRVGGILNIDENNMSNGGTPYRIDADVFR